LWHDPEADEQRREMSRKGGQSRSNKARAKKLAAGMGADDLDALLAVALKGVLAGRLTPGQGQAAASLARAMVAVREYTAVEDLDRRLAELERSA
jgi:hypothetical protein